MTCDRCPLSLLCLSGDIPYNTVGRYLGFCSWNGCWSVTLDEGHTRFRCANLSQLCRSLHSDVRVRDSIHRQRPCSEHYPLYVFYEEGHIPMPAGVPCHCLDDDL